MDSIKTENGQSVQGTEQPLPKLKDVEAWIQKDTQMCVNFLNAIATDPDLRRSMATWMLGRMQNQRNQEALKKQAPLFDE